MTQQYTIFMGLDPVDAPLSDPGLEEGRTGVNEKVRELRDGLDVRGLCSSELEWLAEVSAVTAEADHLPSVVASGAFVAEAKREPRRAEWLETLLPIESGGITLRSDDDQPEVTTAAGTAQYRSIEEALEAAGGLVLRIWRRGALSEVYRVGADYVVFAHGVEGINSEWSHLGPVTQAEAESFAYGEVDELADEYLGSEHDYEFRP